MCTVVLGHSFLKQPTSRMFFCGHASWKRNPQRSPKSRKHINDTETHSKKMKHKLALLKSGRNCGSSLTSCFPWISCWALIILVFFFSQVIHKPKSQVGESILGPRGRCPCPGWSKASPLGADGVALCGGGHRRPGHSDGGRCVILSCFMEPQSSLFFLNVWSDLKNFHRPQDCLIPIGSQMNILQPERKRKYDSDPPKGPPGNAPCDQLVAAWGTLWWIRHGLLDNHPLRMIFPTKPPFLVDSPLALFDDHRTIGYMSFKLGSSPISTTGRKHFSGSRSKRLTPPVTPLSRGPLVLQVTLQFQLGWGQGTSARAGRRVRETSYIYIIIIIINSPLTIQYDNPSTIHINCEWILHLGYSMLYPSWTPT